MARSNIFATIEPTAVADTLQAAAAAGRVVFYVRRSNGTRRRMAYLRPGTAERRLAERIDKAHNEKGVPMKDVALKLHVSIPTVRRILNNLELSRHIEDGDLQYAFELVEPNAQPTFARRRGEPAVPAPREAHEPVTA